MIGRSIYKHPLRWSEIDQKIYGIDIKSKSASDIIFSLIPYIEKHLTNGGKSWEICKHLINLVEGIPKAKIWRNQISTKSIKKELDTEYLSKLTSRLKEMGYEFSSFEALPPFETPLFLRLLPLSYSEFSEEFP